MHVIEVSYGMGFVAMDAARKSEVFEILMSRPRVLTGAAERTSIRYKATAEKRRAAMIDGIIPPSGMGEKRGGGDRWRKLLYIYIYI